jgi:hypothetical protein
MKAEWILGLTMMAVALVWGQGSMPRADPTLSHITFYVH